MEYQAGRTVADIIKETGQSAGTIRKAWHRQITKHGGRIYGLAGGLNATPTEAEFLTLWKGRRDTVAAPRVAQSRAVVPAGHAHVAPARKPAVAAIPSAQQIATVEKVAILWVPLFCTAISIGYTAFGCVHWMNGPGWFLAGMFACSITAGLVLSRSSKGATADRALVAVYILEGLVTVSLHPFTFRDFLPQDNWPGWWVAACIAALSTGFMSSASLYVSRNWHAEK